jgi:hypothetical protein
VDWLDPAGYVQELLSKVKPCPCVSIGVLVRVEHDHIVVASGAYLEDDSDPTVDATAISRGCITLMRRV